MPIQQPTRRSYLVSITTRNAAQKTAMRNALWRFGGHEILPDLYLVALTTAEYQNLTRRFGAMRIKKQ